MLVYTLIIHFNYNYVRSYRIMSLSFDDMTITLITVVIYMQTNWALNPPQGIQQYTADCRQSNIQKVETIR